MASTTTEDDRAPTGRAFVNGRILPMVRGVPPPEVVVIERDRIIAVGKRSDLGRFPGARIEDLHGRTLCPGFIDAHHHLSIAALHPRWADASDVSNAGQLASALRAQADRDTEAPWLRAAGWSELDSGFAPDRHVLDACGLDRPVIVAHFSLHQGVVCSRGLEELGIGRHTPDPPGGEIRRDRHGEPSGLLVERAWTEAHRRSLAPYDDPDRWAEHIERAAHALPKDGITAIHDAACPPAAERAYGMLAQTDRLAVSVLVCPHPAGLLGPPEAQRLAGAPTGAGREQLRVGPVKLFADGGGGTRTGRASPRRATHLRHVVPRPR